MAQYRAIVTICRLIESHTWSIERRHFQ